ncbi:MAG: FHA domain-containing protein [Sulfuriflexus sp.]|nr:FHA domain-containing protein [Sulfuriflexus sp.]
MPTLTLAFKGKTLQVFPLEDGLLNIGREPSCDVHIDSLAVEPQHARLVIRDKLCTLTQSNTENPTFVNHKPIEEHVLEHNDVIRIGKHTLKYRDETLQVPLEDEQAISATPTPIPEAIKQFSEAIKIAPINDGWLQVMSGRNLGKTFQLKSGLTDLGKLGMSPALIALRENGYFISNLTDDDPLSVADKDIGETSHPLNDGDVIKIGKLTLQFHLHA